jgi:BirA family biotin operon repressor/biotin-[acetyl-CoA-carboxylase] ligase
MSTSTIALHKLPRYHFRCVDSTNSTAVGFLEKMPFPGVIITADEQLAGRGRLGRSWNSEESANLYFSLGIRHNAGTTMQQISLLQGIGALATLYTIHSIIADHLRPTIFLKYPNDVVGISPENGALRKIAGILVENTFSGSSCTMSILGIGVNIQQRQFPKELEEKALSLVQLGCDVMPITFADKLEKMLQTLLTAPIDHVLEQWQQALRLPGLPVKIVGDSTPYIAQHLTPESTLVVTTPDGNTRIINDGDSLVYEL